MDYQNKYLKYKNKYLNLKNQIGGNKRFQKELTIIREDSRYNIIRQDNMTAEITTRTVPSRNYTINIPENYPFKPPQIFSNGSIISFSWSPGNLIKNILDFELTVNKKVLILCHPEQVTGTFEPLKINNHWIDLYFQNIFSKYNLRGTPKFDTVDTKEGGTYQDDAFNPNFINKHINDYDLVLVPDCGGPWYYYQGDYHLVWKNVPKHILKDPKGNKTLLITLVLDLCKMVKPGGLIYFGKFLSEEPCIINETHFPTFSSALIFYLNHNGFICDINKRDGIGLYVVAQKK